MDQKTRLPSRTLAAVLALMGAWCVLPAAKAQEQKSLQPVLKEQLATDEAAVSSQGRVESISDETRDMLLRYRQYLKETQSIDEYSRQLSVLVESQAGEIESVKKQLLEVESTARDVLPLMLKMVDGLDRFVSLDLPFQLGERRKRIASLREAMDRADVTVSEKYRRIVEAYQIEIEYGRTLEAYQGELGEGPEARTVRYLRVGRVALLYQTLDGEETGYWDAAQKRWIEDDSYRAAVRRGFAVADKSSAPDLLTAPIPAPVEGRS